MKEDVLEQIVDDYLQFQGYFTTHNVRFKPDSEHADYVADLDRVPSDVDVVALHPTNEGVDRVLVVSCKSWQTGFNPRKKLTELRENSGPKKRPTWHHFRELWSPKWAEAFRHEITRLTGQDQFAYRIAVTRFQGDSPDRWAKEWNDDPTIRSNLPGCSVGFLTLEKMWTNMLAELRRTPAASEIGRLAQLLKAAGLTAEHAVAPPSDPAPPVPMRKPWPHVRRKTRAPSASESAEAGSELGRAARRTRRPSQRPALSESAAVD